MFSMPEVPPKGENIVFLSLCLLDNNRSRAFRLFEVNFLVIFV